MALHEALGCSGPCEGQRCIALGCAAMCSKDMGVVSYFGVARLRQDQREGVDVFECGTSGSRGVGGGVSIGRRGISHTWLDFASGS